MMSSLVPEHSTTTAPQRFKPSTTSYDIYPDLSRLTSRSLGRAHLSSQVLERALGVPESPYSAGHPAAQVEFSRPNRAKWSRSGPSGGVIRRLAQC
jgi:hypothetical protein